MKVMLMFYKVNYTLINTVYVKADSEEEAEKEFWNVDGEDIFNVKYVKHIKIAEIIEVPEVR